MQFLSDVVPTTGYTCLTYIHPTRKTRTGKSFFVHEWVDLHHGPTVKHVLKQWRNLDCYFAMGSFDAASRKLDHVVSLRSIWLDIDAGPVKYKKHGKKVYRTAQEALDDFSDWQEWANVPDPTYIVSSGYGLHVYWALDEDITPDEWEPLAHGLKVLAREGGLKVDTGPSINKVGVLRVPGSMHQGAKAKVKIIERNDIYSYDELFRVFGSQVPAKKKSPLGEMPEHIRRAMAKGDAWDNRGSDFAQILRRSRQHGPNSPSTGCEQLWLIATEQESIDEPLWRAGLSIAQNCEASEKWTHLISKNHPDYSADETDDKRFRLQNKPYTCERFDDLCPGICKHCPHNGKIKSPIQLGAFVRTADNYDDLREKRLKKSTPVEAKPAKADRPDAQFDDPDFRIKVDLKLNERDPLNWKPPFPFKRRKGGGIVVKGEEGEPDQVVYDYDLICTDRMYDAVEAGEVLVFELYLPNDEMREIKLPLSALANDETALKVLMKQGYMEPAKNKRTAMMTFLRSCGKAMVADHTANVTALSLGWNKREQFVLGHRMYTSKGVRRAAISEDLDPLAETTELNPKASLREWSQLVDMYNMPGMEPAQLMIAASLAGPLFRLHGTNGPILHAYTRGTGTGKTTAAAVALSIWGRPDRDEDSMGLMAYAKDTEVSIRTRLTFHNSIPMCVDEITDLSEERIRNLIYEFTQGTEKGRGTATGGLMKSHGTWDTCMFTTGNASLFSTLASSKSREALFARFLELDFRNLPTFDIPQHESERNLRKIKTEQAGIVGHVFARWLAEHRAEAEDLLISTAKALDKSMQFTRSERYWRGAAICLVSAARLGVHLGAWDFDVNALVSYITRLIKETRQDVRENSELQDDPVTLFLLNSQDLTVTTMPDGRIPPTMKPGRGTVARIDRSKHEVWIVVKELQTWTRKNGYNYRELERQLRQKGAVRERKYILTGSDSEDVNLRPTCWVLDMGMIETLVQGDENG